MRDSLSPVDTGGLGKETAITGAWREILMRLRPWGLFPDAVKEAVGWSLSHAKSHRVLLYVVCMYVGL